MAKWIAIIVVLWVVSLGAVGYAAYGYGVQTGQTQAQNIRAAFFAERGLGTGAQGASGGQAFGGQGALAPQGAPGGQGTSGQGGGRQLNPANFVGGQVKAVDGNTIQLSTANAVVNVKVGDQTQIQKMGQASLGDIKPGDRITAQGSAGSNGEFAAQSIQVGNLPFGGGNAPRGQGAGAAATPNP